MKIQSIGTYYSQPLNNTKKIEVKTNNINFGDRESEKWNAAYALFEQIGKVEMLRKELIKLEIKDENSIFFSYKEKIDQLEKLIASEFAKLETYDRRYKEYDPSKREFFENSKKGFEQKKRRAELDRFDKRTRTGDESTYWNHVDISEELGNPYIF